MEYHLMYLCIEFIYSNLDVSFITYFELFFNFEYSCEHFFMWVTKIDFDQYIST